MLPSLDADFDVRELDRAFDALEHEIEDEMRAVFESNAKRTQQTAVAIHPWQNRTGQTEASIEALPPTGRVFAGTLQGGVVIGASHASYLEAQPQWAVLEASWQLIEPYFERDAQAALDRAALTVGLR